MSDIYRHLIVEYRQRYPEIARFWMPNFEAYDHRMGCVAVQYEGRWWVVKPNGKAFEVATMPEAQATAAHLNATATDEDRESWRVVTTDIGESDLPVNPKT